MRSEDRRPNASIASGVRANRNRCTRFRLYVVIPDSLDCVQLSQFIQHGADGDAAAMCRNESLEAAFTAEYRQGCRFAIWGQVARCLEPGRENTSRSGLFELRIDIVVGFVRDLSDFRSW